MEVTCKHILVAYSNYNTSQKEYPTAALNRNGFQHTEGHRRLHVSRIVVHGQAPDILYLLPRCVHTMLPAAV